MQRVTADGTGRRQTYVSQTYAVCGIRVLGVVSVKSMLEVVSVVTESPDSPSLSRLLCLETGQEAGHPECPAVGL